jgi:hypothetical protein
MHLVPLGSIFAILSFALSRKTQRTRTQVAGSSGQVLDELRNQLFLARLGLRQTQLSWVSLYLTSNMLLRGLELCTWELSRCLHMHRTNWHYHAEQVGPFIDLWV